MAKLWNKDDPIIRSLLETDVYKIMMMYLIWKHYPNLRVTFSFINRTEVRLPDYVDLLEFQKQLREIERMRFSDEDIAHVASWGMHEVGFLNALRDLELTAPTIERRDGAFWIVATGSWFEQTLWEIYVLAIGSELYMRGRARKDGISEAGLWDELNRRTTAKIEIFRANPGVKVSQFGLRRRASGPVEDHVTMRFLDECPGTITGVSNVYLAKQLGVEAQGTNAHELAMALVALARHESDGAVRDAVYHVLELWQRLYGHKALIMLDDTYGSDRFRAHLPRKFAEDYRGFRHDSGDPIEYGEQTIEFYRNLDIDPSEKMIIFSDGLTAEKAVEIFDHFAGRIIPLFGIGTSLTNDLGLVRPLSLVMKIVSAAGNSAVKLSNNLNKATGDEAEVAAIQRIFGYTNRLREEVVY